MATIRKYDPVRADKLARNDWYRMRRYLEIALSLRDAEIAEGDGAVCRDVFALLYRIQYLTVYVCVHIYFKDEVKGKR